MKALWVIACLCLLLACGKKDSKENSPIRHPGAGTDGGTAAPESGPAASPSTPAASPASEGSTPSSGGKTPSTNACHGLFRYEHGTVFQEVTLFADQSCKIENNGGIVESASECTYAINGTKLTLSSGGYSVAWLVAADCAWVGPNKDTRHFKK